MFLIATSTQADAYAVYREMKTLSASRGRDPESLRILATIMPILGSTEAAARQAAAALDALAEPEDADRVAASRFTGTAEQLVDLFETWHEDRCCDGFNILPAVLPNDLTSFVETVIPLARSRGLVRSKYEGETLRAHLGLAHPRSRYAA